MMNIKRALISVYDKTGIVDFARELNKLGIVIIATGGTFKTLKKSHVHVRHVSDVTKFPEILGGRVKTEHPKLIGGVLANKSERKSELKKLGIESVDMVICNPYPLEIDNQVDLKVVLENIDVGGPNMIRAAAKNFENVVVIVNSDRYSQIMEELKNKGDISFKTRFMLATEAFKLTARYDRIIYRFLKNRPL